MNRIVRWGRFSAVGAMGMMVQMGALLLFNRCLGGHYLWAAAVALEVTLLHNFVWHWHYTWRDRRDGVTPIRRLLRFQISNGLVSMLGNLVLMRVLVNGAHMPLVVSNLLAIGCCSMANFCLGDGWAFARGRHALGLPRF